jgi:hypothetical protein
MRRDQGCADALAFTHANLVHDTWIFHSIDPRDKVFALFGILNSARRLGYRWTANYTRLVEDCYVNHTKSIINQSADLRILSSVQDQSARRISTLPSWVPDYGLPGTNPLPFLLSAAGDLTHKPLRSPDLKHLRLEGAKLATILHTGSERKIIGRNSMFAMDPSWFELILHLRLDVPDATVQSRTEILWRKLCADHGPDGYSPAPGLFGDLFRQFVGLITGARYESIG